MISAEHTVDIHRPIAGVFEFVSDQANEPSWHTDVLKVSPEEPLQLGSTVTWVVKFMGQNEYVSEVTSFEPQRRIELTATEGPLKPILTHRRIFREVEIWRGRVARSSKRQSRRF